MVVPSPSALNEMVIFTPLDTTIVTLSVNLKTRQKLLYSSHQHLLILLYLRQSSISAVTMSLSVSRGVITPDGGSTENTVLSRDYMIHIHVDSHTRSI